MFVVIHHLVCPDELWTSSSSRMILSESTKSPNICLWLRKACMEVWWNWTLGLSNSLKNCWGRGWSPLCWLLTNLVYTPRFSQAFISKAVQGPEVTFIQQGGSLYALGYTRDPRTEVNVRLLLLRLHNVMPSPQQLGIVCQTWEIPQWVRPENAAD